MDDTQNNGMNPQPAGDGMQVVSQPTPVGDMNNMQQMSSLGDIAGMTPPPAPIQPVADPMQPTPVSMQPEPAPIMPAPSFPGPVGVQAEPVMDLNPISPSAPSSPMPDLNGGMSQPVDTMATHVPSRQQGEADDYSYAEDLLDEILDSLDRIEAKLEAIEKKVGQ